MLLLSSADFFQNQLFWKNLSEISSECQTVWIQIRPDILSGLIWVQTVCKSYQQTTLVGKYLTHKAPHIICSRQQLLLFNSFHAITDFCHLLIYFANSLDPDQDRPNGSGSKPFDTLIELLKEFFEKVNFEKNSADNRKNMKNYKGTI